MNIAYFNTASATGEQLDLFINKAQTQNDVVLKFFRQHPRMGFTPAEVHRHILKEAPLTSIRRAITSLTKSGFLEKTTIQRPGIYDRPEHIWTIVEKKI